MVCFDTKIFKPHLEKINYFYMFHFKYIRAHCIRKLEPDIQVDKNSYCNFNFPLFLLHLSI